ncbi:MAG: hypothetical protein DRR19_32390 [Candidatus Parabeggiatoa sp. nov. 1]|nr:MAG: hypothetical protein DRR19_32390 [Gammaproteobacteria bacterium]
MHKTTSRFWKNYENLPASIQKIAKKNFNLLKEEPLHPSLHFKRSGKFWSARVDINHRALAIEDDNDLLWVWIGTHDEYEKMLK